MPIYSKYSDEKIETILTEMAGVLTKHQANPDLSLMILGNLVTHILNTDIPHSQRRHIADKFSQALLSSIRD